MMVLFPAEGMYNSFNQFWGLTCQLIITQPSQYLLNGYTFGYEFYFLELETAGLSVLALYERIVRRLYMENVSQVTSVKTLTEA